MFLRKSETGNVFVLMGRLDIEMVKYDYELFNINKGILNPKCKFRTGGRGW